MVSKKIINDVIDKTILTVKCGVERIGNNSLNNHIKGAMNKFYNDSKNYPIEHEIFIDNNGHIIKEIQGNEYSVKLDNNDYIEITEHQLGDVSSIHNHVTPFGEAEGNELQLSTMFSENDIKGLWNVNTIGFDEDFEDELIGTLTKTVSCQCSNGSRLVLTRKDGSSTDNPIVKEYLDNNGNLENSDLYNNKIKVDYGILVLLDCIIIGDRKSVV